MLKLLASLLFLIFLTASSQASDQPFQVTGTTKAGDIVKFSFDRHSADFSVRTREGAQTRLWFDERRAYVKGPGGDAYPYPLVRELMMLLHGMTSRTGDLRSRNLATGVTGAGSYTLETLVDPISNWPMTVTKLQESVVEISSIDVDLREMKFTNGVATSWLSNSAVLPSMSNGLPPVPVKTVPLSPINAWYKMATNGKINARVNGEMVSVGLDSAEGGVSVSRKFFNKAQLDKAQTDGARYALLSELEVSGRRVPNVFARVVDRSGPDLRVGVTLFPRATIEFSSDGLASISNRKCASGALILPGAANIVIVGSDAVYRRTLLDVSYSGPPEMRGPLSANSRGTRICDARPRIIRFGSSVYGSDVFCRITPMPYPASSFDILLGPSSMKAKLGIIDLQNSRFCIVS